jgi:hypothetical protein
MADNTCHFGVNSFFADNGLSDVQSWLYFPADPLQMIAVVQQVFFERGLRFIFSTRSKVPYILKEDGKTKFFDGDYKFVPGKDETIVEGTAGYIVSFGEMLYRSWDAVLRCRQQGLDVGLINKPTLNIVDEQVSKSVQYGMIVFRATFLVDDQKDWLEPLCPRRRVVEPEDWCAYQYFVVPMTERSSSFHSLAPSLVHGCLSAGSLPGTGTWAPSRRAAVVSASRFPTKASILNVRLIPSFTCLFPRVDSRVHAAIIIKIKQLSQ